MLIVLLRATDVAIVLQSLMFFNDYVNNLTVKLRKSYYSLYKRIQLSCNSLIVQLYEYNIVFPSPLFTMWYNSLFV